ncbi:MAG: hypothetical protein EOP05_02835 [Proteobacteria bacterium]|nr:MAG: hypothetical protein EOP05_02835 [Pseudomonadota bacterium]
MAFGTGANFALIRVSAYHIATRHAFASLGGNTASPYAFIQKNPKSAEFIAEVAGTWTVTKKTERYSKNLFLNVASGETSVREAEGFVIHPNRIKSLRVGGCIVVKKYPHSDAYMVKVDWEK